LSSVWGPLVLAVVDVVPRPGGTVADTVGVIGLVFALRGFAGVLAAQTEMPTTSLRCAWSLGSGSRATAVPAAATRSATADADRRAGLTDGCPGPGTGQPSGRRFAAEGLHGADLPTGCLGLLPFGHPALYVLAPVDDAAAEAEAVWPDAEVSPVPQRGHRGARTAASSSVSSSAAAVWASSSFTARYLRVIETDEMGSVEELPARNGACPKGIDLPVSVLGVPALLQRASGFPSRSAGTEQGMPHAPHPAALRFADDG
jgi:hypothetical protein